MSLSLKCTHSQKSYNTNSESVNACSHVKAYKNQCSNNQFRLTRRVIYALRRGMASKHPELGLPPVHCVTCRGSSCELYDLYACLDCVYIGCQRQQHVASHSKDSNHVLWSCLGRDFGTVYCSQCNSTVFDVELECDSLTEFNRAQMIGSKRRRQEYIASLINNPTDSNVPELNVDEWIPSLEDLQCLKSHSSSRVVADRPSLVGLRGLSNLGNTCFMNCVMQGLLHNPLMIDYLLLKNSKSKCRKPLMDAPSPSPHGNGTSQDISACVGCEIEQLVTEVYSGESSPFIPHSLLYAMWVNSESLAGYHQQDAHEFFIATLNAIHMHFKGSDVVDKGSYCDCLTHALFSGVLRSDVSCLFCGNVSTKEDPFLDISLDIDRDYDCGGLPNLSGDNMGFNGYGVDGDDYNTQQASVSTSKTIASCMERFTHPEKLGGNEKALCSNCATNQVSTKQLSILHLPSVLCFQLKRFYHSTSGGFSLSDRQSMSKIDLFIEFPLYGLDLFPFISETIAGGNRKSLVVNKNPTEFIYDLFCVVDHQGTLVNGHYFSYVCKNEIWYKCDDTAITAVNEDVVKSCCAYLLFYIRRGATLKSVFPSLHENKQ